MKLRHDPIVSRLLQGKDTPSVVEREALWASIASELGSEAKPAFSWARLFAVAVPLMAAGLLFLVWPKDVFIERGDGLAVVQSECLQAGASVRCAPGAQLALQLKPPKEHGHFVAFIDDKQTITWLVRDSKELGPSLAPLRSTFLLPTNLDINNALVHVVFMKAPMQNVAVKNALEHDNGTLTVIKRKLVQP